MSVYANVVELIRRHHASEGNVVLDLGCGFGAIAEAGRDLGLTYIGFDNDTHSVKDRADRGFQAVEVDLSDLSRLQSIIEAQLNGRSLAAVTALDFLEHITNGVALLDLFPTVVPVQRLPGVLGPSPFRTPRTSILRPSF